MGTKAEYINILQTRYPVLGAEIYYQFGTLKYDQLALIIRLTEMGVEPDE